MDLAGLIALYRIEADDHATPPHASDETLIAFAVEAEEEACRRAGLLRDSTSKLCSLTVSSGDPIVEIDARIIDVMRARLASDPLAMPVLTLDDADELAPNWESETGKPRAAIVGYQSNALRLYPIPTANDTLRLTVTRLPMNPMEQDSDEPEIKASYHRALVQWMLYRAYSIQNSELLDPKKADKCLAAFESEFGKRQSARNEQWRRDGVRSYAEPIA